MSLLWSGNNKNLQQKKKKEPSPTHQTLSADSAQNPNSSQNSGMCRRFDRFRFREGTSLPAFLSKKVRAGMTVEASIALPLFLFFFLNLGCAIEMIRLHGNLQLALWQIGSRMAVYGYALDSGEQPAEDGWWRDLAGIAAASTFVKGQIIQSAGADYLDRSPLANGAGSLQLWESEIFGSDDEIDVIVTYSVSPWIGLIGFRPFRMANRYYAHVWNGYRLSGTGTEAEETVTVYVTESGTVYHLTMDCTHLRLSVQTIASFEIDGARNQEGSRYHPCSRCTSGGRPPTLYITNEGDKYHYDRGCSGLRRTVSSMTIEQAQEAGYRSCSRCGG